MRGPKPTTNRGRRAGGREIRAWVSAEEHERIVATLHNETMDTFVRKAALEWADSRAAVMELLRETFDTDSTRMVADDIDHGEHRREVKS